MTDRDIVVRFVAEGADDARSMPVSEIMTSTVTVVGPDDDLSAAGELMHRAGVRRLAVSDGGRVVGVLEPRRPGAGHRVRGRRADRHPGGHRRGVTRAGAARPIRCRRRPRGANLSGRVRKGSNGGHA